MTLDPKVSGELALIKQQRLAREAKASGSPPIALVSSNGSRTDTKAPDAALGSTTASEFSIRAIRWFWPARFALGKLGLIGGLPDKGKGLISADIIARCTTGADWPCNEGQAPQGDVIWFTAEDDIEDTVIPRLVAAGADLKRVHIVGMTKNANETRMFNLATDLPLLEQKLEQIGDVVLVIIDPVSAYLGVGKINNSSTTDVRGVLAPLTKLAEEKRLAIIGIMHFNKKADVSNAMLRIADSLAYVAAARHVYVVVDDAENEKARLFVKAKNNLAADKHALRFMVGLRKVGNDPDSKEEIWAPHVIWDSTHVEVTATEAMEAADGGGARRAAQREAEEFLKSKLARGPLSKEEIEEEAEALDISVSGALKRAKKKLQIKTWKEKGKVDGKWFWELPVIPATIQHNDF
jgi:AAA domain